MSRSEIFDGPLFEKKDIKELKNTDPGYQVQLQIEKRQLEAEIKMLELKLQPLQQKL